MKESDISAAIYGESPWENNLLHPSYKDSFLSFCNAPEYLPSEALLASLYRRIGLRVDSHGLPGQGKPLAESGVGRNGSALLRLVKQRIGKGQLGAMLSVEGWERTLEDLIRSPNTPNQGAKRFLQMTPVVPSAAIYSMAARLRGNPWNPGALIESCLCHGSANEEEANTAWEGLFRALSVDEKNDDVWAVFLEREFAAWSNGEVSWVFAGRATYAEWMCSWPHEQITCPARRFATDISHIVKAKNHLTRRQWTSVLEAIIRMGLGAQVLWIAKVNYELYRLAERVIRGDDCPDVAEIAMRLSTGDGFWSYGQLVGAHIKKLIRNYLYGRVGLNLLLYRCAEIDELKHVTGDRPFRDLNSIRDFLTGLAHNRKEFAQFHEMVETALDADPRKLAIKQGVGKNMEEFLRHGLGQRETQERGLQSYDQGYLLCRRGPYSRAPWVLGAGPVTILALVHCCARGANGARTVEDLCSHLADYGIKINADEAADSSLGSSLRTLGLVLDSPDAEGGMVLIDPFTPISMAHEAT